jgi:cytosine deaminase
MIPNEQSIMKTKHLSQRRLLLKLGLTAGAVGGLGWKQSIAQALSPNPSNSVGVPEAIIDAEDAAQLVLYMAKLAEAEGTFGVGGAIVDNRTGKVIKAMHNRVLQIVEVGEYAGKPYTFDPTAHGERQLVSWYFENAKRLKLPPPSQLTVVSSLDPCAMCAGSLITAGFNVGVVAYDYYAGINYDKSFEFKGLPPRTRRTLKNHFGYYAVSAEREYVGNHRSAFSGTSVTSKTANECLEIFAQSADKIREISQDSGLPPDQMQDPAHFSSGTQFIQQLKTNLPEAFSLKLQDYRRPDKDLYNYLRWLKSRTLRATNAVAFIDPFGNLIAASADTFDISPISTAFMNVVQRYSLTRFNLINNQQTTHLARLGMTAPKYGTFVFLRAPTPDETTTLKDLGAYGSTMEGPIPVTNPSNFLYFRNPQGGSVNGLLREISGLPPFYNQLVKISPERSMS